MAITISHSGPVLKPGSAQLSGSCLEARGTMCYMSGSIQMENIYIPENEAGLWQWLFGKNVTSIVLHNNCSSDGFIGIAAPHLARILPIDLAMFGGELLCQPDAFLCSINDVKVTNTIDQRARNDVAGAEVS
ncbi:tryptophan RNA-binding attenuator protein-like protein [Actinidia rufa]|uniref:Tryptophan RNA-binding attenuator protein-like protein n=1 Tax=Actinidia rufa TaxID=165716 RepID=A0A7J0FRV8_9ERIC|nr:tryptophan RNA-binding attenuator protein-like protein [Actinidia rufa]